MILRTTALIGALAIGTGAANSENMPPELVTPRMVQNEKDVITIIERSKKLTLITPAVPKDVAQALANAAWKGAQVRVITSGQAYRTNPLFADMRKYKVRVGTLDGNLNQAVLIADDTVALNGILAASRGTKLFTHKETAMAMLGSIEQMFKYVNWR